MKIDLLISCSFFEVQTDKETSYLDFQFGISYLVYFTDILTMRMSLYQQKYIEDEFSVLSCPHYLKNISEDRSLPVIV